MLCYEYITIDAYSIHNISSVPSERSSLFKTL